MDKSPHYWYKRRRFGYGWTPVTWQAGVLLLLPWTALVASLILGPTRPVLANALFGLFVMLVIGLAASLYYKAPSGKWRWGKHDGDDPNQDF